MLERKINYFTPFKYPHATDNDTKSTKRSSLCLAICLFLSLLSLQCCPEPCSTAAFVNPVHSQHSSGANTYVGGIFC